jgi:hypothetical protein
MENEDLYSRFFIRDQRARDEMEEQLRQSDDRVNMSLEDVRGTSMRIERNKEIARNETMKTKDKLSELQVNKPRREAEKLRRVPIATEYREDSFPSTYTNQQIIQDEEDEQPKQVTIKEKVLTRKQLTNQLNKQKRDEENKREGMRKKDEKILKDPKAIKYIKAQDKEREDVIRKGKNLLLEKGVNREIQPTIFKYVFEPDRMPTKEELSVMSKQESAENARNSRGGARAGGAKVNKSTKK